MILTLSNLSSQAVITCADSSGVNRILLKPYNINRWNFKISIQN